MRIIAVDDDSASLKKIEGFITKTVPDADFFSFDSSLAALAKAREEEIDVAFLDVKPKYRVLLTGELEGEDGGRYM